MLRRVLVTLFFVSVASLVGSWALAQVDSLRVAVNSTPQGPTILDQIASLMAALTPILAFLVGTGLVTKYVPGLQKVPNLIIPFLNALIAFFGVFSGPAPAHASIFGDFVHALSFPAKAAGSFFISAMASAIYETYLRPFIEKMGWYPPGTTHAQAAVITKAVVN